MTASPYVFKEWDITAGHGVGPIERVEIPVDQRILHKHASVKEAMGRGLRIHGEVASSTPGMKVVLMRQDS
jgi:hypothetical protein